MVEAEKEYEESLNEKEKVPTGKIIAQVKVLLDIERNFNYQYIYCIDKSRGKITTVRC